MPRNGSGTYSVPTTFVANTPALAADVNTNFTDVATALTASLAIDGQSAMTGQFKAADGSITAPGVSFSSDTNTGFYRSASGVIRASCDGTNALTIAAATVTVPVNLAVTGTTTFTGAVTGAIPAGIIAMWSGTVATIPSGWLLCDGTNSTPDLRNRFIIGANTDTTGVATTAVTGAATSSGGSKDAVNVSHTHTATSVVTDPGHAHGVLPEGAGTSAGSGNYLTGATNNAAYGNLDTGSNTTGITVATSNSTEGSSGTNANLPPYYALAFIMKS